MSVEGYKLPLFDNMNKVWGSNVQHGDHSKHCIIH